MSFEMKTVYNGLVGAWGGFLAWVLLDVVFRFSPPNGWIDALVSGATVGMLIGALVSSFSGVIALRPLLIARGLVVGWLTGIVGGIFGLVAGEALYQFGQLFGSVAGLREAFRTLGWAIFGFGIGIAEGVLTNSPRRLVLGGVGGVLGGFIGGIAFILVKQLLQLQMTNRAVGFAILGAVIGLLVGLVPIILKEAWLRAESKGRTRDFLLDKRVNTIGRADHNDIGLYGDKSIAPDHAEIRQESGQFVIYAKPGQTVIMNDAPVARGVLQDGARIRIGQTWLVFRRRK